MKTIADLKAIRERMQPTVFIRDNADENTETRIVVGMATCGISAGARAVFNTMIEEVATRGLKNVKVMRSGCMGMCQLEPVVEVFVPGKEKVTYVQLDEAKAKRIVSDHIVNGTVVTEYTVND